MSSSPENTEVQHSTDPIDGSSKSHFLLAVVALHGQQLLRFFASRFSPADVQDLVQDVYLRILSVDRPELIRSPKAYVFRIAINMARERWLKHSSRPQHLAFEDLSAETLRADAAGLVAPALDDVAVTDETLGQLEAVLAQLSPEAQTIFIWANRDGHTYNEIASRLAVSKNRVKKCLAKARAHCRRHIPEVAPAPRDERDRSTLRLPDRSSY